MERSTRGMNYLRLHNDKDNKMGRNNVTVKPNGVYLNGIRICSIQNARERLAGTIISVLIIDIEADISQELESFLLSRVRP